MTALAQLKPARYGKSEQSESWVATLSGTGAAVAPSDAALAAYARLGQAQLSAAAGGDAALALQLQQFEQQYPGFAAPAIDRGLLARRLGQLPESESALRQAAQLEPNNALAWTELGVTLREEGKFVDAREAYGQALAHDPDYAPAHRDLGVLLDLYLGDPVAALPEFQRYQQLSGEDKPVSTWIAELRTRTGVKAAAAPEAPGAPAGGAATTEALAAGDNGGPK